MIVQHKQNNPGFSQEGFGPILLKMPVICHELDHSDVLVEVSDEWLSTFGYERQNVIGKEFKSFLSQNSLQNYDAMTAPERYNENRCEEASLEVVKSDGGLMNVLYHVIAQKDQHGKLTRFLGVIKDHPLKKKSSYEHRRLHEKLEELVRTRTAALNEAHEQLVIEIKERKRTEVILRTIAEGVHGTTGDAFFTTLVQFLTKTLKVDHAIIGLFDEVETNKVRTLAVCLDGLIADNFSYDINGTPCARTNEQKLCIYPKRVKALFPADTMLEEMQIESYIGIRLDDSSGRPVGLLVLLSRTPIEADGTITSMLQVYASRVAAEIERNNQEEQLMRVRNLESLGRMAAGIAHEVNNPLTNASINIQMLRKNLGFLVDETPILKRVEAVERNIERASNIAKELLLFSRQKDLVLVPVHINTIIEKAFTHLTCDLNNVEFVTDLPETPEILGDSIKLEGLFINLFNNALDAMPGGGTLSVSCCEEGGMVIIKIHDTGHGIAKEDLSKIFEPFFTTKEVGKGTGLGLSIVYGIIRQHKGTIEVVDTHGRGATFIIKIPAHNKGAL